MFSRDRSLKIVGDGNTSSTILVRHLLRGMSAWKGRRIHVGDSLTFSISESDFENDALLLVRFADPAGASKIGAMVRHGVPYAYFIDDNFWLLLDDSPLSRFYKNWSVRRSMEKALAGASVVMCHSKKFRDFLLNYNPNVVIVPPFFDSSVVEDESLLDTASERRIGIVANASKARDLDIIVPAVLSVAEQSGDDVFFEFFGYIPPELEGHPKIRSFAPINDYPKFLRTQYSRNWLTALAPLQENRFSSYKSNNKFREFGGCGIAGIYSDVEVYRESIVHGKTGWLVSNTPEAWAEQISLALDAPAAAREVGHRARKYVRQHFSHTHVRRAWIGAIWTAVRTDSRETLLSRRRRSAFGHEEQAGMSIATAGGWVPETPSAERAGFYAGEVLFNIDAGDVVQTQLAAPVSGEFHWNMLVATFMRTLTGVLTIEVLAEGRPIHTIRMEGPEVVDNQAIAVDLSLEEGQQLTISVRNDMDEAVGFYLLSPNGTTTYASTGRSYAGRFVA